MHLMSLKTFTNRLKTAISSVIKHKFSLPYWVEITTQQPNCIYYFGSFDNYNEAETMQHGYIEDLREEKAIGISAQIKRCLPTKLTIVKGEELF